MNRNFAKPREDMTPEFAPDVLEINGRKVYDPKAVHCKIAGYLPLSPDWPVDPPEGRHYERTDKIEPNGADGYRWTYRLVDDPPPPPRTFRRSYLAQWIRGAGKWGAFAAFLADPAAADLAFLWEYCTEFDEDAPQWPAALAAIKAALQLTGAEAAQMLEFGATGGQP